MRVLKMKNRNKKGIAAMISGLILILAALGLNFYNYLTASRAGSLSDAVLEQFPENDKPDYADGEISDYILNSDMDMPETEIDKNTYIGIIEIPSISQKLPVMSELTYPNLKIAPCRYKGSVYKNNMIIAAHNYQSHFGNLKNLKIGSAVIFTDTNGNRFNYVVSNIETIDGGDIEQMESGDWDLTLFTCTYGGKTRVTVRCDLETEYE